jgi:L-fucose mutarotase
VAAGWKTPVWDVYRGLVATSPGAASYPGGRGVPFEEVERFAFYERAKRAYAVVATGEGALYGNLILKKGVIGSK